MRTVVLCTLATVGLAATAGGGKREPHRSRLAAGRGGRTAPSFTTRTAAPARLPLHPAGRQPQGNRAHLRQPDDGHGARRPLARRVVELRRLGRYPRRHAGLRARPRGRTASIAALPARPSRWGRPFSSSRWPGSSSAHQRWAKRWTTGSHVRLRGRDRGRSVDRRASLSALLPPGHARRGCDRLGCATDLGLHPDPDLAESRLVHGDLGGSGRDGSLLGQTRGGVPNDAIGGCHYRRHPFDAALGQP